MSSSTLSSIESMGKKIRHAKKKNSVFPVLLSLFLSYQRLRGEDPLALVRRRLEIHRSDEEREKKNRFYVLSLDLIYSLAARREQ